MPSRGIAGATLSNCGSFSSSVIRATSASAFVIAASGMDRLVVPDVCAVDGDASIAKAYTADIPIPMRADAIAPPPLCQTRSEEHTSELQSLMRISYAVFCLKQKKKTPTTHHSRILNLTKLYNIN